MSTEKHQNMLRFEKSPYLLQHAANPVHWQPWGDEAFARARAEDKPVFLSSGYSTCHWCHVMERESFEDPEVAALLNESYVCIKVDREERPDIDSLYMSVCTMLTGSGGWPLTVIMTPERKPFFAGTYFPKENRGGRPGLVQILPRVAEIWRSRRSEVEDSGSAVVDSLQRMALEKPAPVEDEKPGAAAFAYFVENFDQRYGGFGQAPKFPSPHSLLFLLRHGVRAGRTEAVQMSCRTLSAMRLGGLWDHVGFGFHRYSTDQRWLLPHFEKMLYDQAMLLLAYSEAYAACGEPLFRQTAAEILSYLARELTGSEGGLLTAEDADSEGEEGKYYVWTEEELRSLLEGDDAAFLFRSFGTEPQGNFADEASGIRSGANILHLSAPLTEKEAERFEAIRQRLLAHRNQRVHPHLDDKVLTDWNGLAIGALARAGLLLDLEEAVAMAEKAAAFLRAHLVDKDGRLLHRWRQNEAAVPGMLDDYAFLAWGLLELYQATLKEDYLLEAKRLTDILLEFFWDDSAGGFFGTASDTETLLLRNRECYDGAIPSGNSMAHLVLLELGRLTGRQELAERARLLRHSFGTTVLEHPHGFTWLLLGLEEVLAEPPLLVLVGDRHSAQGRELLAAVRAGAPTVPRLLYKEREGEDDAVARLAPHTAGLRSPSGLLTAYLCSGFQCHPPTTDAGELGRLLAGQGEPPRRNIPKTR